MNARTLFTVAAIFNALVGLGVLLAYDLLAPLNRDVGWSNDYLETFGTELQEF
ncbi:MAG: hypothetical protein MUO39_11420 [Steroidobacteraceae bacterium]|nr:hypothetical protein [Steroidobacteraceae bacterium]